MKRETTINKLNALLGITDDVVQEIKKKESIKKGRVIGITEDEIQTYRQAEGVSYFLQAPELFHARVCKNCGEPFLVSRLHVAYCSYDCIAASVWNDYGVVWSRERQLDSDPEQLVKEIFDGNEPLWIRNLPMLQKALSVTTAALEKTTNSSTESPSSETNTSSTAKSSISTTKIPIPKLS